MTTTSFDICTGIMYAAAMTADGSSALTQTEETLPATSEESSYSEDPALESLVRRVGLEALDSAFKAYDDRRTIMRMLVHFSVDRTQLNETVEVVDGLLQLDRLFCEMILPVLAPIVRSCDELKEAARMAVEVSDACRIKKGNVGETYFCMLQELERNPTLAHWKDICEAWLLFYDVEFKLPADPCADRASILRAIRRESNLFRELDDVWRGDPVVALAAIRWSADNLYHIDRELFTDRFFQKLAFGLNWNIFPELFHPETWMKEKHGSLVRSCDELGILMRNRFNTNAIEAIIRNRRMIDRADPRPALLVLYPRNDHNKALVRNQIWKWIDNGWRALYFEAENADDLRFVRTELTRMQGRGVKMLRAMIVAGHSTPVKTAFGANDPREGHIETGADTYFDALDPSMGIAAELALFDPFLADESDVIVEGCGAGAGEGRIMNVLNRLASFYGRSRLHGPTRIARAPAYRFDAERKLASVDYGPGIPTYVIEPRR